MREGKNTLIGQYIAMRKCSIKIYINHVAHSVNRFGSIIMIQTECVFAFFLLSLPGSGHSVSLSVHRIWVTIIRYRSWLVRWSLICWNCVRKYLIILNLFYFVRFLLLLLLLPSPRLMSVFFINDFMTVYLAYTHVCTNTHIKHIFFLSRIHKLNNIDKRIDDDESKKSNKIKRMFPISSNNFNKNLISVFFPSSIWPRHFDLAIYFVHQSFIWYWLVDNSKNQIVSARSVRCDAWPLSL